ncbi:hypothetical protein ACOSP7_023662 [Xanthoceras sorbifolium]
MNRINIKKGPMIMLSRQGLQLSLRAPLYYRLGRNSKCQGSKTSGTWNSTLIKAVHAPFDDQVTMATMHLSGDTKQWWRTRYKDVLECHCEINAWEELNRKLKERLKVRTCALPHHLLLLPANQTRGTDKVAALQEKSRLKGEPFPPLAFKAQL